MEVILVCAPKVLNVCKILFTVPHQNLECLFIGYNFRNNKTVARKFSYVFELHRFALYIKYCYCIVRRFNAILREFLRNNKN